MEKENKWQSFADSLSTEEKISLSKLSLMILMNFRWDFGDTRLSGMLASLYDNIDGAVDEAIADIAAEELDLTSIKEDGSMLDDALNVFDTVLAIDADNLPITKRYRKELKRSLRKGAQYAVQSQAQSAGQ